MKIRTLIICLLTVCFITKPVFAQISANTSAQNDSVIISGTVLNDEAQIVLIKPGFDVSSAEGAAASNDKSELGNVIEYFGQVTAKNNNIETAIPMRADAAKGKYLLIVDNDKYPVYFATLKERLENMMPAARIALANGTFAQFAATDGKYFCNSNLYEKLSSSENVAKYAENMLDEFTDSDNSEFMAEMSSALNMGIIIEALNENKINDFAPIKLMTDSRLMILSLDKIDLIEADKVRNVVSDVSGKNFVSAEEYTKRLSESIFINVINNGANMSNADKKVFFEMYAKKLGMNLTYYEMLSDNKKTEVIAKISATNFTTLTLMQSSLDVFCKGFAITVPAGDGTPAGNGGGGGGSVYSNTTVTDNKVNSNTVSRLVDLEECQWAKTAIEYLVNRKMINGYEDNTFRPQRNISRAEFISIIAREYLPSDNYTQSFSDVAGDSWYFNYVESAYNNGIINGTGSDVFSPDQNISRQDMAVMLYRLAQFKGYEISGASTEFSDDAEISDYAKKAIYNLKSAGILKGNENGNFNPDSSATRAEAVQMIYNFIKFLD